MRIVLPADCWRSHSSALAERRANCWEILLALAAMIQLQGRRRLPIEELKDAEKTASGERALSQKAAAVQSRKDDEGKDEGGSVFILPPPSSSFPFSRGSCIGFLRQETIYRGGEP